jgi:hypothetical protein
MPTGTILLETKETRLLASNSVIPTFLKLIKFT